MIAVTVLMPSVINTLLIKVAMNPKARRITLFYMTHMKKKT